MINKSMLQSYDRVILSKIVSSLLVNEVMMFPNINPNFNFNAGKRGKRSDTKTKEIKARSVYLEVSTKNNLIFQS